MAVKPAQVGIRNLVIFVIWVIIVVVLVILMIVFAKDVGVQNDWWWVPIVGGIIALIFGIVLLCCCKEGANRLSWRKRMLMYSAFDNMEEEDLKNSEFGIRAGKEGAWIEVGHKSTIGKAIITR